MRAIACVDIGRGGGENSEARSADRSHDPMLGMDNSIAANDLDSNEPVLRARRLAGFPKRPARLVAGQPTADLLALT
jgi:hypothetical protein